jgi:TonB family protein
VTELSVGNLITYSAQVMLVVSAAAVGAHLVRLPFARARLVYWRLIVVACLILPLFPVLSADVVFIEPVEIDAAALAAMEAHSAEIDNVPPGLSLPSLLAWLVIAGVAARALWIGLGLVALARLRKQSGIAALDEDVEVLRRAVAPRAELRWHDQIAQPVTFGWRRPVILLPRRVAALPLEAQRGVVCHELLHVARRDWAWMLVEEAIRCAFWFHPAMWWALAQVQLSREEAVDEQVIRITTARRPYMNALVMFADGATALASAIPFIRRRHLASRIRHLSEEHAMSYLRFAIAATALAALIVVSSWGVAFALPLHAREATVMAIPPAPVLSAMPPVQVSPTDRAEQAARRTAEAPKELRQAAAQETERLTQAAQEFQRAQQLKLIEEMHRTMVAVKEAALRDAEQARQALPPAVVHRVDPVYPEAAKSHGVEATVTLSVTAGTAGEVVKVEAIRTRLTTEKDITDPGYWGSQPSRAFNQAAVDAVRQWRFEPSRANRTFELTVLFTENQAVAVAQPRYLAVPPPPPPPPPPPEAIGSTTPGVLPEKTAPARVRVGGNVRPPTKVADARPVYPAEALAARVQGVVILETVIATDGSVSEAKVLRSIPLLDQAAIDAVRQWRFQPTLLNGQPVEVVMVVTVNFTLE